MSTGGRKLSGTARKILSAAGVILILGALYAALFTDAFPFLWFVLFSAGALCTALVVDDTDGNREGSRYCD